MSIRRDWNEFFFALRPATTLGLFRILLGTIIFAWTLLLLPYLRTWYSEQGLVPLSGMVTWNADPIGLDILAHTTSFAVTCMAFGILMLSSVLVAVGYKTRIAQVVMWVLLTSFQHRDMLILNGGDTMQRNLAFLMMFADSGAACSVDRLIRIARGIESADHIPMVEAWPQRLIQMQLSVVYLTTALSKLLGPEWRDGTALYYALNLTDLQRFTLFGLRDKPWFYMTFTYMTLFTEFSLGTAIWVRRLRPYVLLLGVGLHLGIEYAMTVPLFSFTMIATYLNFFSNEWIDAFKAWASRQFRRSRIEVPADMRLPAPYEDLLRALDSFQLVRASADVSVRADASLFRRILWRFPATWGAIVGLAALVLYILPTRWFVLTFDILWPIAALCLLQWIAKRVAAQADYPSLDSILSPNSSVEASHSANTPAAR